MRKFTTQILSLLTALSFAGALSAQTVEDAIGAADNATGGLGLTIEAYGLYGINNGSGTSLAENATKAEELTACALTSNNSAICTGTTANKYITSATTSLGGGLNVIYDVADNLGVVVGFKFNSYSGNSFKNSFAATSVAGNSVGAGSQVIAAIQNGTSGLVHWNDQADSTATPATYNWDNMSAAMQAAMGAAVQGTYATSDSLEISASFTSMNVNLGLRPRVAAWGGEVYAGGGLNVLLPTEITTEFKGGALSATKVSKYNMSILGFYGEFGYNYPVMDNLTVGLGVRGNVNTIDNNGTTTTTTLKSGSASESWTVNHSDSFTAADTVWTNNAHKGAFETVGITDIGFHLTVGYRL